MNLNRETYECYIDLDIYIYIYKYISTYIFIYIYIFFACGILVRTVFVVIAVVMYMAQVKSMYTVQESGMPSTCA